MATHPLTNAPVVLIIRDGWGHNPHREHDRFNAIHLASTPVADSLMQRWPNTLIRTSGEDVGLPHATMGNSEVGHQNIGAGRIVDQEIMRITRSIRDGSFFDNESLTAAFQHAGKSGRVHLLGLVSDGKVHSDIEHLLALIELAARCGFPADRLFVHAITDGRDTGPKTAPGFIERVERTLADTGAGRIATVIGRYYAMDRDHRWERIARAYSCLTNRNVAHPNFDEGQTLVRTARSAQEAIKAYYDNPTEPERTGDEFIEPTQIVSSETGEPIGAIDDGDAVIFFNYRGDRPRELTKAFVLDDAAWPTVQNAGFDRGKKLKNLHFCTMTGYEENLPVTGTAFEKPPKMKHILGEVMSSAGYTQFRCAETEKFAHVTFFFNDYREKPFEGEHRLLVQSPTEVSTYDQKPEMSAPQVCDAVIARLEAEPPDVCEPLIIVNFANGDMVGHTGKLDAAIKAVETVDECVGRIVKATRDRGGSLLITADHGNAEQMWNPATDSPHTAHTTYDVPLIIVGEAFEGAQLPDGGRLADIAPTVLAMLGIEQPSEMTGEPLVAPVA